jgi:hypothetical protein
VTPGRSKIELANDGAQVQGSIVHSARSFLFVTPPMCCLDIVRMIVSPRPSHPFGISMVGHDVVVVCKLVVADGAFRTLLQNFAIQ